MYVKKRGEVITHKNVFVPRHVLFLGLMYSFFLVGGTKFVLYFFIGLLKHEVLKMLLCFTYFYMFKSKLGFRNWNERKSENNVRSQKADPEEREIDSPQVTYIIFILLIISRSGAIVVVIVW